MPALKGKVAVITGGSSGIGLATAKRFADEGAYVFIAGRRQSELDNAVSSIGKNVAAVQADVSKLDDLDRLYQEVAARKGKIDIVVAAAGMVEVVPTPAVTSDHFDKTFNTNAKGSYFTVQKALPIMNDGGSVILIGSAVWLKVSPLTASTPPPKRPCVPLSEPGPPNSRTGRFEPTSSVPVQSRRRSSTGSFQPKRRRTAFASGSSQSFRWAVSAGRKK